MTTYAGQCDLVRRKSASNEDRWQAMMGCAQPVAMATFLREVDISPLLDEDESPRQFIADAKRADPSTTAYRSYWGPTSCWFLQTAGYEYIFLDD